MTVTLRPRIAADDSALINVFVAAWHHAYQQVVPPIVLAGVDHATVAGWLAEWDIRSLLATVVAENDGTVVGFARFGDETDDPDSQVGYLAALYVHPDAAGGGVGRLLLHHALAEFRTQGRLTASLWVFRDNPPARHLYISAGFTPDGRELVDPRWQAPQIRMTMSLLDSSSLTVRG